MSLAVSPTPANILDLDDALTRLAERDSRKARLVELRYFGGMSCEEAANVIGTSVATANRDLKFARAWLRQELSPLFRKPDSLCISTVEIAGRCLCYVVEDATPTRSPAVWLVCRGTSSQPLAHILPGRRAVTPSFRTLIASLRSRFNRGSDEAARISA